MKNFEEKLNKLGIDRVFTRIPKKMLDDAISFYAKKVERQSVVALVDDTIFFQNAGLVFTTDALYAKPLNGKANKI